VAAGVRQLRQRALVAISSPRLVPDAEKIAKPKQ